MSPAATRAPTPVAAGTRGAPTRCAPPPCAALVLAVVAVVALGCAEVRDEDARAPAYEPAVRDVLVGTGQTGDLGACGACHGDAPEAGWSVLTYLDTIACVDRLDAEGLPVPATQAQDGEAPLLAVLDDPVHAGLLTAEQRALLEDWVAGGAPSSGARLHPAGYANPRSAAFHAADLRSDRWSRMFDPEADFACGACHAGAPNSRGAPLATAPRCTSCHDEPEGVLDCGTCHGLPGVRAMPPGDLCFFPEERVTAGAHMGHPAGVACTSCHADRTAEELRDGLHGNGVVELDFDPAVAGPSATWDAAARTCTNACHNRGGTEPQFLWSAEQSLDCNACHLSPPADHYAGPCTPCHAGVDAAGTEYVLGERHGNGVVELGTASGGCGACHGDGGDDPWPTTGAHASHRDPALALPADCAGCHVVPTTVLEGVHLNGVVDVVLSGLAAARGNTPTYDPATRACATACHGDGLVGQAALVVRWDDASGEPAACGTCHAVPPPPPHSQRASCGTTACHAGIVNGFGLISADGRARHVNGSISLGDLP